jgi:maltose/moltooligosaccharide transporter
MSFKKPILSFSQIISMNVGFFGIQYSFGLQQSAVNPIYDFLGANPDDIPFLNLAGHCQTEHGRQDLVVENPIS